MNAAIQFLRSIPEFDKLVKGTKMTNVFWKIIQHESVSQVITAQLAGVLKELDGKDVVPKFFVQAFLTSNPEFTPFGQQFDSDEFMQKLLTVVSGCSADHAKAIKEIFEIQMIDSIKNTELPD